MRSSRLPDGTPTPQPRGRGFVRSLWRIGHVIVAAEVMTASPDFGHLGPMLAAARREGQRRRHQVT
jgi:hypothetical protein